MKRSVAETAKTRKRIVEAAAKEFRQNGIGETGIAEVMKAAGLSQGGFYRHFDSKQALVAEACAEGMDSVLDAARNSAKNLEAPGALEEIVSRYLSREHRENTGDGCPLAALGSEIARNDDETNRLLAEKVGQLTSVLDETLQSNASRENGISALAILSAMMGAVTLSRILTDERAANDVLDKTRDFLVRAAS